MMTSEKIKAALAAIVAGVEEMGAARFRAELDARASGPLAQAFAEISAFASDYLSSNADLVVSAGLLDAIEWGVAFQQSFDLCDLQQWLAANDDRFALAA